MSYNPIGGNLAMGAQGAFIRKVYLMLTIQLLVVASMVLLSLYNFQYKLFVLNSITILAASIALIVLSLIIACCFQVVRPIQVPVYIVFTLLEGLVVSSITARYPSGLVAMAAIMTTLLVIILTIYACILTLI
jgi:FtsH-binding integral membrane protein